MEMAKQTRYHYLIDIIQQTNRIADTTQLDELLDQMLDLIIMVTQSQAGSLYLYNASNHTLIFKVVKGDAKSQQLVGTSFAADRGIVGHVLSQEKAMFIADVPNDSRWDRSIGSVSGIALKTMYCMPLLLHNQPVGVVQLFNLPAMAVEDIDNLVLLHMLADRLVTEVEKARLLEEARQRERRQQALIDIIAQITTTLERDELLDRIMSHARDLLDVEATSIWLWDERRGDLLLHLATGERREQVREIRVPAGKGIIGHVVETGETVLVNDVHNDSRFYSEVDKQSGFQTYSILCVPLRAPRILLGGERGELQEMIIGGAQALNKRNGQPFEAEEVTLFETLASQAATVLRLSQLYEETSELYLGIIDVISGAIDLRDPDTAGHSQRVSDFAVAIAREMELPSDLIYRIRIGGMLHDVGKIGIPDSILTKPARLTDEEWEVMRSHPERGVEIVRRNNNLHWRMRTELKAISEHHERLDGRGYPKGLRDEDISQVGRIMAVADVFDALTSDRRYRPGMPAEQVLQMLRDASGTEFDADCVAALIRARAKGAIQIQQERSAVAGSIE